MKTTQTVRDVQNKILDIMKYIDKICRDNDIVYYIMGGTALGAIRHGGFIPWDDDLDIFMTPDQYAKFKQVFETKKNEQYVIQEWRTTPNYLEYAKVRMNGTTFIEHVYADRKDMHHGIYVDIMILHKVPVNRFVQKLVYLESKYVTVLALSQRNWVPKNKKQALVIKLLKILPNKLLANICYKRIYKYDTLNNNFYWSYWITKASFEKGLFLAEYFSEPVNIPFEDTLLLGSSNIKEYLSSRYGDYMKLPSAEEQKMAVHAEIFDTERDYREYIH